MKNLRFNLYLVLNYLDNGIAFDKIRLEALDRGPITNFVLFLAFFQTSLMYGFFYVSVKTAQYILNLLIHSDELNSIVLAIAFILILLSEIGSTKLDFLDKKVSPFLLLRAATKFGVVYFIDITMTPLLATFF